MTTRARALRAANQALGHEEPFPWMWCLIAFVASTLLAWLSR